VPVLIATRGRRAPTLARHLGRTAKRLLDTLQLQSAELSLVLVSDPVMHDLNRRWRGKDRTTDVLAFPQQDVREGPAEARGAPRRAIIGERTRRPPGSRRTARIASTLPERLLGDVVISVDTARKQAAERGHSIGTESERLLVHGVLHLLGYDHERSGAEARRMQRKERALLRVLGA
jgi:probable rRNA maturation factor